MSQLRHLGAPCARAGSPQPRQAPGPPCVARPSLGGRGGSSGEPGPSAICEDRKGRETLGLRSACGGGGGRQMQRKGTAEGAGAGSEGREGRPAGRSEKARTTPRLASTAHPGNPSHPEGLRTQHRVVGGGAGPGRSQTSRASSPLPARLPGCPALGFLRLSRPPSPPGGSRFPRPPWSPASTLERHCPGASGLKEPEKPES